MNEEKEKVVIALVNEFAGHTGYSGRIASLQERGEVFEFFTKKEPIIYEALQEFVVLVESLAFVKTDKMLMLKARDIWKMEVESLKQEEQSSAVQLATLAIKYNIDVDGFKAVFGMGNTGH